jgi:hypothetical protein
VRAAVGKVPVTVKLGEQQLRLQAREHRAALIIRAEVAALGGVPRARRGSRRSAHTFRIRRAVERQELEAGHHAVIAELAVAVKSGSVRYKDFDFLSRGGGHLEPQSAVQVEVVA